MQVTNTDIKAWLMRVLANWRRWVAEGCKKHGYGKDEQLYYDYDEVITPVEGQTDVYEFAIKTFDSPDGDSWWRGTFRTINGGTDVEILTQRSWRS